MDDLPQSALAILREWDWMAWTDEGHQYLKSQDLSQVINRLGFEGHPKPSGAVLQLLCSGELLSRAQFDWQKSQNGHRMYLPNTWECLKPNRWQTLAGLIEQDRQAASRGEFGLDRVKLVNLDRDECAQFEWEFAYDRFSTATCSDDLMPFDDDYFEEWFSAWDIEVWPRTMVANSALSASKDDDDDAASKPRSGGRPSAKWWPDFAEELALYVHECGIPDGQGHEGQSEMMEAIFKRLVEAGKPEPGRATVQRVINAVMARIRSAGN